jgi:DNA-directed RNA polymerase specialized sigma24 family protein
MEPISFRSFEMYVMEELPANEVAATLGISVNAVYINKCRAIEHLRRTIRELEKL